MKIQEQIEALTQELRPYPEKPFWYFDGEEEIGFIEDTYYMQGDCIPWYHSLFASTDKAEVDEYADCYHRLKLYQLMGKKAEKESPIKFDPDVYDITSAEQKNAIFYGTDFGIEDEPYTMLGRCPCYRRTAVLGGVWFANEEDRLAALESCNITKEFQEKCAKYGLGGA